MSEKEKSGAKPVDWKCLRCGHMYVEPFDATAALVERQCPSCRSNSVRRLPQK